jgi:hypothetical protein
MMSSILRTQSWKRFAQRKYYLKLCTLQALPNGVHFHNIFAKATFKRENKLPSELQLSSQRLWINQYMHLSTTSRPKKILSKDMGHVTATQNMWQKYRTIRDFVALYWQSVKSFIKEINLAARLSYRIYLKGHRYTRSERIKMQRAAVDVMKVLPFVSMTLVVGTEITALLAARAVPSMLPQAFQPVAKKVDENLPEFIDKVLPSGKERALAKNKTRVEIADKLHELSLEFVMGLKDLEHNLNADEHLEKDIQMITQFLAKTDQNELRTTQANIAAVGPSFRRRMPLQKLSRIQLVRMAQYMNQGSELLNLMLPTFVLIRRLRMRVQNARADDKDIHFEGVASLNDEDLRDACFARGLSRENDETYNTLTLRNRLRDWISLSINRDVPSSLLILSSAFISRSQLKLEQEHGASGVEAAALQQRINELNAKISKRIQQRDEAKEQLALIVGINKNDVNVNDMGNIEYVDDTPVIVKDQQAKTPQKNQQAKTPLATVLDNRTDIARVVHRDGGTVFDALNIAGITNISSEEAHKLSIYTDNYFLGEKKLTWEEFYTHFEEGKIIIGNSKEEKIRIRKEAIDRIEGLLSGR